jgi:hypothetical protein
LDFRCLRGSSLESRSRARRPPPIAAGFTHSAEKTEGGAGGWGETGGGATGAFGAAISGTVEIGSAVATGATLSIASSGATLCTSVGGRRSGGVALGVLVGGRLVNGGV